MKSGRERDARAAGVKQSGSFTPAIEASCAAESTSQPQPSVRRIKLPLGIQQRKLLLIVSDLVLVNAFALTALHVNIGTPFSPSVVFERPIWFVSLTAVWLIVACVGDNYDLRQARQPFASAFGVIKAFFLSVIAYVLLPRISPPPPTSRITFLLLAASAAALLGLWRIVYAKALAAPAFDRRLVIVGAGWAGSTIARVLRTYDPSATLIGYIDSDNNKHGQTIEGVRVLGSWTRLDTVVTDHQVSDIVLAITHQMHSQLVRAVLGCVERGVRVTSMPEVFEQSTERIPVEHIGDRWVVSLPIQPVHKGFYPLLKRIMDITISMFGLLIICPLMPLLALAIKLDSPGPVFYRPERLGRGGRPFRLWKLRTMVSNADKLGDPTFTKQGDARITRLGRFLRATHIDEFPQFVNILRGEMSVVGPRPERYVPELEEAIPFYRMRYAVKPGTAGWALIKQGYADGVEDTLIKLQYDLYYIKHQSLFLDVFIIMKTMIDIVGLRGR